MHCPECGYELTLKDDFCPQCGENFEHMDDNEKKRAFNRPLKSQKISFSNIDSSNVNGYFKQERKLKRGSSTSRGGTRAVGHDTNTMVRKAVHNLNAIKDDEEPNRPVKLDYERKKELEKEILGKDDGDEINI